MEERLEEGVEEGGEEGEVKIGWWQSVFGRCARDPVPWWRIGSPGSQARTRARKHCHQPNFKAKLASF